MDLVVERSGGVTLVEAKSAATPSSSLFRGAERVRRHFRGGDAPDVVVVYGGEERQVRGAGTLVPWREAGTVGAR